VADEYDSVTSLMAAVEAGRAVAPVSSCFVRQVIQPGLGGVPVFPVGILIGSFSRGAASDRRRRQKPPTLTDVKARVRFLRQLQDEAIQGFATESARGLSGLFGLNPGLWRWYILGSSGNARRWRR
jgi:hypothetical protein